MRRLKAALEGRYAVERELGRGGMAAVFLARDVKHDREVAIKVLHPELAASVGADRFEREIRLAAKLQHPHILGLHDSGAAGELLYYVMPFVKGESLRDRIDREGMLPIDDAVAIALEVNDALGYAHSQGVIHRDIKPENVLLSGGHALVADFGIARAVSPDSGVQKITATGMSMGTPYYMSPEQASGEVVGPTADLYSLGCMLYEMLAGEPPFTGKNAMQIMARHAMEQVPSIRIVRNSVPEEVEDAIFAALEKTPADRPQSAAQFAEYFGLVSGHTAGMRARTTMTRRVPSGPSARFTQQQPVPVPEKPAWWRRPVVYGPGIAVLVLGLFGAFTWWRGPSHKAAVSDVNARHVAVLYFDDGSSDHSLGPVADGLTEELIHSLSTAPSLTVISQSGVERYRGTSVAADSIARALKAAYLVRGEIEPENGGVRVNVKLSDATGYDLTHRSFTVPARNVSLMRDTLATVVSDLIRKQLGTEIQLSQQRSGTQNSDAWLLLQRGEQAQKNGEAANVKGDTAGLNRDFVLSDSLYGAAQSADAHWAEAAWMRAALDYRRSRLVGGDPAQVRQWISVGLPLADHAIQLDSNSADAYEVRGNLRYWGWLSGIEADKTQRDKDLMLAKVDLEKSTTLNHNQAGAWATLSHLYYQLPTTTATDVELAAQHALDADEFLSNANVIYSRLFDATYDLGQFDKAATYCNVSGQRFPNDVRAVQCRLFMLTTQHEKADIPRAWRVADSASAMVAPAGRARDQLTENMLVAAVIARASKQQPALADSARHVVKRNLGDATIDPTSELSFYAAFVYTLLGDKNDAIEQIKRYVVGSPNRAASLRDDPGWYFKDIADDPRYRRAVGAVGSP